MGKVGVEKKTKFIIEEKNVLQDVPESKWKSNVMN